MTSTEKTPVYIESEGRGFGFEIRVHVRRSTDNGVVKTIIAGPWCFPARKARKWAEANGYVVTSG